MKTKKPAKRRASEGEKIAAQFNVDAPACQVEFRKQLTTKIDRAIRAAVRKRDVQWMDAMVLQGLSPNIINGVFRRLQEIDQ